ncbi:MAG: M1 family metallopeptidase [Bacteroidales bacterium]|nr:M1 family metallopeptidase [Bacteroidales bacterium]
MLIRIPSAFILIGLIFGLNIKMLHSQQSPSFVPLNIQKAIKKNTRTVTGKPGTNYWQNNADYKIDVSFDPKTRLLKGQETISYFNNSPDTLNYLLIHLFADLYKKESIRDFVVFPQDQHDGIKITSITVNKGRIDWQPESENVIFEDTYAWIQLLHPLVPESQNEIKISWSYTLNLTSHMRTGQVDSSGFFIAYWFPRIGVYDDIQGWNAYNYAGNVEFYNDFGNFDVNITVPGGFVVWATGELQNPKITLSDKYYRRFKLAMDTDQVIGIIDPADIIYRDFTAPDPEVTWHYKAENVSDFAFALSDHFVWDAIHLEVDKAGDKKVFLSTAYDKNSPDFSKVIHIAKKSIEYMSDELPAVPFPYPSMTVFNGLDEMEYPMMVNDHSLSDIKMTFSLTAHEIYHTYFPFLTGCNEQEYTWMDEGLTSFFEYNIIKDIVDSNTVSIFFLDYYYDILGTNKDLPLFSSSGIIRSDEYYAISYTKAAIFYSILENEMGKEKFREMIREFIETWKEKHPTGIDFLNFVRHYSADDLNWLIRPWFFEFGYVDLSIEDVTKTGETYEVKIRNNGNYPAPVNIRITYTNRSSEQLRGKASYWATGAVEIVEEIQAKSDIKMIELFHDIPMDAFPENNIFILK